MLAKRISIRFIKFWRANLTLIRYVSCTRCAVYRVFLRDVTKFRKRHSSWLTLIPYPRDHYEEGGATKGSGLVQLTMGVIDAI